MVLFCSLSIITLALFTSACGGSATPTSPKPTITPTASPPTTTLGPSSPTTQLSAGQHLRFDRIPTEQGLSQATVISIIQDNQGFIWFGTEDGLNRYDGYNFTIYRHDPDDPNSLSDNRILSIIQDRWRHLPHQPGSIARHRMVVTRNHGRPGSHE